MLTNAFGLGANAVANVRYQIIEATAGHGILIAYFYGTAVLEKKEHEDKDKDFKTFSLLSDAINDAQRKIKLLDVFLPQLNIGQNMWSKL